MSEESQQKAEDFITTGQLQTWLGINNAQRLSFQERGMPFIRIGATTLYHLPAVCGWLKQQESRRPA